MVDNAPRTADLPRQGRRSSVSLCGITSLPGAKADEMQAVLHNVAETILEVFEECKDPKVSIEAKIVGLGRLAEAEHSINRMYALAKEEAEACVDEATKLAALALCTEMQQAVKELTCVFARMRAKDTSAAADAARLMISALDKCICVLRFTDKGIMARLTNIANNTRGLLRDMTLVPPNRSVRHQFIQITNS